MKSRKNENPIAFQSRTQIILALASLIEEKDYKNIKIKEIAERADVVRQTFYRNYKSKDEVMKDFLIYIVDENSAYLKSLERLTTYTFSYNAFEFWSKRSKLMYYLLKNDLMHLLVYAMYDMILLYTSSDTPLSRQMHLKSGKYATPFLIGALVNVIREWCESGMHESPEEMAQEFTRLYDHVN